MESEKPLRKFSFLSRISLGGILVVVFNEILCRQCSAVEVDINISIQYRPISRV